MSPLIIITIFYILGILLGNLRFFPVWFSLLLIVTAGLGTAYCRFKKQQVFPLILALIFCLGSFYCQFRAEFISPNDVSRYISNTPIEIIGKVDADPVDLGGSLAFILRVEQVKTVSGEAFWAATGKASVMLPLNTASRPIPSYGDKLWLTGKLAPLESLKNPGLFSYADYQEKQGIHCRLQAKKDGCKIISKAGFSITKTALFLQKKLVAGASKTLPAPYDALLSGIVLGSKAAKIPGFLSDAYRRAGVSHLLVASGMQITILVGIFVYLGRFFNLPVWLTALLSTVANILCTLIVGGGPSILRAAVMSQAAIFSLLFERESEFYTSFSLAALVLLIIDPLNLFDIGFQLSFAATWSLVYISPVLSVFFSKSDDDHPRFLANLLSISISPILATAPVCAYHFSEFSLIGVVTNILILPWVSVLVILGFISAVAGPIFLPLAYLINSANLFLLVILNWIVLKLASIPFATMIIAAPNILFIAAYYIGLVCFMEGIKRKTKPTLAMPSILIVLLMLITLVVWNGAIGGEVSPKLKITVLDIGQGDAILVEAPTGEKMLVDGGDVCKGGKVVIPILKKKGVTGLDLVVLTHPHADHLAGLLEIMEKVPIRKVLDSGQNTDFFGYRNFLSMVQKNKTKYHLARGGQIYTLADNVQLQLFNPFNPLLSGTNSDLNSNSIAFRLKYHDFTMFFTGDMEKEGEERVLSSFSKEGLRSQVLKVGHHGSRTATSIPFLEAISPQYAIISCGRHNKFRHPHKTTLQKLQAKGIRVYRTDQDGAVLIETYGNRVTLKRFND